MSSKGRENFYKSFGFIERPNEKFGAGMIKIVDWYNAMNILFICSRNRWRSLTAEMIFKGNQFHEVRSAGTENDARIRVNEKLINWADILFVMEKRHKERLQEKFDRLLKHKQIVILDIEDNYQYMDEDLIDTLTASVAPYL